jgi:DNA-binding NarL/FixJ family response regulator
VIAYTEQSRASEDQLAKALMTTIETGNFDAFVHAYRSFPNLLEGLTRVDAIDTRPLSSLVASLDPRLAERVGLKSAPAGRAKNELLTRREREVLDLAKQGMSNREIARALWIAESTVKVHMHHVLEKLGARSRTEAVALSSD